MGKPTWSVVALLVFAVALPTSAQAYIGPGMGAGALAAVVGVLGSIVLGIFAVIYYPIKRMMKRRKSPPQDPRA
jgi:uncharacterized integral membrane protein